MCAVNDAKRAAYDAIISNLNHEYDTELDKLNDIQKAKGEVEQLISKAQCAIDNLAGCNFGSDGINTAIETSQKGYYMKRDYYDDYTIKCKNAMLVIDREIASNTAARNAIPANCGSCPECCPPEPNYWYNDGSSAAPVYNGTGCFLKGTKVVVENGYKNIDEIEIGDVVLSYNIENGKNEYKKVTQLFLHPKEKDTLYSLTINEKIIEASSAHRFFIKTNDGFDWISAKDLKIGNIVLDSKGFYFPITNITSKNIEEDLYNIKVEDNHNYYVTELEILVQNRK